MTQKIALITGAGRGIGRAVALAFAREGVSLWLTARTEEQLLSVSKEAKAAGAASVEIAVADLTQASDLDRTISKISEAHGRLDVLVQNAGVFEPTPVTENAEAAWDRMIDLNLSVPYRLLWRVVPLLKNSDAAHVFHIVSVAGRETFAGFSGYCASKHGLLALTNVAREELRTEGIKVTSILPGAVDTPAWDGADDGFDRTKMLHDEDVARALLLAWRDAPGCMTEEIVLRPQLGNL